MAYEPKEKDVKQAKYAGLLLTSISEEKKTRTLTWSSRDGYPRITVFTDNEIKKPDGSMDYNKMITAPFAILKLKSAIRLWTKVLDENVNGTYEEVDCMYPKIENGVKHDDEKVIRAKARFGIDNNGICYFYIEDNNKPKIKFNIVEDGWHVWRARKNAIENRNMSEMSKEHARSYLEILTALFLEDIKSNMTVTYTPNNTSYNKTNKTYTKTNYQPKQEVEIVKEPEIKEEPKVNIEVKEPNSLDDLF